MLLDNFGSCVSVELLDSDQVHVLQAWTFDAQEVIAIGRAHEQDVTITNPHVSRLHAELRSEIDGWRVKSLGRNGVLLNGERIDDALLADRCIIRLGSTGPSLRFVLGRPLAQSGATMCEESSQLAGFEVDEDRKRRDLDDIVSDDFFQELTQRAGNLRQQRKD